MASLLCFALTLLACSSTSNPPAGQPRSEPTTSNDTTTEPVRPPTPTAALPELDTLEAKYNARIGVFLLDTATGKTFGHRMNERFAYASTFKALAAAVLLDRNDIDPAQPVAVPAQLVEPSPVTAKYAGRTMSLRKAMFAAVTESDNTAANMILDALGGPAGLRAGLRRLGDEITNPVRREPQLNDWSPGNNSDTSTPRALATTLQHVTTGGALTPEDRETLTQWMLANTTGDDLVRAGVPDNWQVADRTGRGNHGVVNCIAVVIPPEREPVVLAILTNQMQPRADGDPRLVADVTRALIARLGY